jgi:hypothetical protein
MKSFNITGFFLGILLLIIGLIAISNIISCKKDNVEPTDPNAIEVTKSGCKTGILSSDSSKEDCIEYKLNHKILHIKHTNAAFNCCPTKVYAVATILQDTILITEKEILDQPCDCNCLYDIEYNISNVSDSTFVIIINEPYITNEAEKLIINTNPLLTSGSTYCKTRSTYPWGL